MSGGGIPNLRWQLPFALMLTVLVSYFDRMNISYALPMIAADYGWSIEQTGKYGGLLMSIFFVGYGLSNIFLSPLGGRFGPRRSLMVIVVLFSMFTYLQSSFGLILPAFIAMRLLLGVSEGIHFPMMNTLTKNWFPLQERSRGNGIWICGIFLAMILAPLVIVPIITHLGWRDMFKVLSILGMILTLPVIYRFIHDSPETHPGITSAEIQYITRGMEMDEPSTESLLRGIMHLARRPVFLIAMFGGICNNISSFGLMSWLPTYFVEARGMAFSGLVWATSIPYMFSIAGVALWSFLGDRTNKRAMIAGMGFYLAGIATYAASWASDLRVVILLFSLAIFMNVAYASNEFAIIQRIIPRHHIAGGTGIYNGLAMMIGGGIGPILVGGVVSLTGDYTLGILTLTLVMVISGTIMLVLGRLLNY